MFQILSNKYKETNEYPTLPSNIQRIGYFSTPYKIITPKEQSTKESIIIYCRSINETFEESLNNIQIIVEIIKIPILCFEYCGFYEGSTFSKGNILGSLLDIHQFVCQMNMKKIYVVGNREGCFASLLFVESCRKQHVELHGILLLNPMEYDDVKIKKNKYNSIVLYSDLPQALQLKKYIMKKFTKAKEIKCETTQWDLFIEEMDTIIKSLVELVSIDNPHLSNVMNEEMLVFEKPNEYQNPVDSLNKITKDNEITTVLINNGYFNQQDLFEMTDIDVSFLPLSDEQKTKVLEIIHSIQRLKGKGSDAPLQSLTSSTFDTPTQSIPTTPRHGNATPKILSKETSKNTSRNTSRQQSRETSPTRENGEYLIQDEPLKLDLKQSRLGRAFSFSKRRTRKPTFHGQQIQITQIGIEQRNETNHTILSDRLQTPTTPRKQNESRKINNPLEIKQVDGDELKHLNHRSISIANMKNFANFSNQSNHFNDMNDDEIILMNSANQINTTHQKEKVYHTKTTVHTGALTIKELSYTQELENHQENDSHDHHSSFFNLRRRKNGPKKRSKSNCTEQNPYLESLN